jgi:hypothetical protein
MGEQQRSKQTMKFVNQVDVLSPQPNGDFRLRFTYTGIRFSQETPFGDMYYDSAFEDDLNEPNPFALLLNKSFVLVITPQGRLVAVEEVEQMLSEMLAELDLEGEDQEELSNMLEAQFGSDALLNTLKSSLMEFPTGPLKKGSTFHWDYRIESEFNMDIKSKYTVKAISKTHIDLEVVSTILADSTEEEDEEGTTTVKMKGSQKGTLRIALDTGMVTQADITQDLGGTVTVESDFMPEGFSIPMELITKSEITSKRIK